MKQSDKEKKCKWEYLVDYMGIDLERLINLGKQGWELIAVIPDGNTVAGKNYFFKRRLL